MRINEAYEHEPIMPYAAEDAAARQVTGCDRNGVQCVDISAPVTLTPLADIGTVVAACQGNPTITCTTDPAGTACEVVLTQRVCVSIPVRYSVDLTPGEPTIACAGDAAGGVCSCRGN